jgi:hypothetical protein
MTNGFQPQQNGNGQMPPQFAQQQYAQPPAQQVPQFGGQQTGGFFAQQPQQNGNGQMPPQFQPPAQPETTEDTGAYFESGAAWISWDSDKGYRDGTPRGGQIISKRLADQTDMDTGEVRMSKFNKGQPLKMLVLELQTNERVDPDDDGRRQMAVKSGLRAAAKPAFEAVGAKDLEIGGWFYAARMRKEPIPNSNFKRNIFEAIYARPGAADPMQGQSAYQAPAPPAQSQMRQPGPIANMPQQHAARIDGMFQQAMQMDPQLAAQAGYQEPQQPSTFTQAVAPEVAQLPNPVTQAYQAATGYPMAQQPTQGQQGMVPGAPQQNGTSMPPAQQPTPQGQPGQWSPFSG